MGRQRIEPVHLRSASIGEAELSNLATFWTPAVFALLGLFASDGRNGGLLPAPSMTPVRLEIEVPPEARQGTPVPVTLRLINRSERPAELALQGRPPAFDVIVTGAEGGWVWRRLEGEVVTAVLQLRRLEPGDTIAFETTWNQRDGRGMPVAPGDYLVRGEVPGDPPQVYATATVPLRIRR